MCVGTLRGQKKVLDPSELELLEVATYLAWMLGVELGSLGRAVIVLNHEPYLCPQELYFTLQCQTHIPKPEALSNSACYFLDPCIPFWFSLLGVKSTSYMA